MSFYEYYNKYKNFNYEKFFNSISDDDIKRILAKDKINEEEFLALLSPKAEQYLENMAQKAHRLALQNNGKAIEMFTPLYLANYCVNKCAYCGFNCENRIKRNKLNMDEIEEEAKAISNMGFRNILILTGESAKATPVSYIVDAVKVLKKYFQCISIEIYPLTQEEYNRVVEAGVDGLTVYQEVYDEQIYDKVHIAGPKKNYKFRLDAPERGCISRMRNVNIGALLGLNEWRREGFATGLHAKYLQDKYPDVDMNVSPPRIRPHAGVFEDVYPVNDKNIVQYVLALRLLIPRIGITISTRESAEFRDNLIPLGVTKMSAESSTEVGGHTVKNESDPQFDTADKRSLDEVLNSILTKGYEPIFKNWMHI
ncbi:2-iminoacetate synthase ThiH [Haloimpatiens sp. FM7330]|uniref:2-iminoacetate synthase ThiH n=1 Tax=Haloimpatiens sp. FM7330 TaxID=3298610 RepID=UPI0036259A89